MTFKECLEIYEDNIQYADRMMKEECFSFYHKTKDYWCGYKAAAHKVFEEIKTMCEDFKPSIEKNETSNGKKEDQIGVLKYRGEEIPVYVDDSGQQLYIVYRNKAFGGGSYNANPEYDFCYYIDIIKDNIYNKEGK